MLIANAVEDGCVSAGRVNGRCLNAEVAAHHNVLIVGVQHTIIVDCQIVQNNKRLNFNIFTTAVAIVIEFPDFHTVIVVKPFDFKIPKWRSTCEIQIVVGVIPTRAKYSNCSTRNTAIIFIRAYYKGPALGVPAIGSSFYHKIAAVHIETAGCMGKT